jgi:hypothetical protein
VKAWPMKDRKIAVRQFSDEGTALEKINGN